MADSWVPFFLFCSPELRLPPFGEMSFADFNFPLPFVTGNPGLLNDVLDAPVVLLELVNVNEEADLEPSVLVLVISSFEDFSILFITSFIFSLLKCSGVFLIYSNLIRPVDSLNKE